MRSEQSRKRDGEAEPAATDETGLGEAPAWEEVAAGRYMPRRTRGSCKGRALG